MIKETSIELSTVKVCIHFIWGGHLCMRSMRKGILGSGIPLKDMCLDYKLSFPNHFLAGILGIVKQVRLMLFLFQGNSAGGVRRENVMSWFSREI